MKILALGIALCCTLGVSSQYTFKALVRSSDKILPNASIFWKEARRIFITDSSGEIVITGIPAGEQHFRITHVGYEERSIAYVFPLSTDSIPTIILQEKEEDEERVVVTATRTSRTIANTPSRIEVISGEELDEKSNMKPGDIRMLLNETTGIQTQQTSATSYNSSIRIQGLDGRYTQILKDGLPLYAGFSGGLSLMQVTPLDLRQVEVIKGSSSTLYGGGAIAGLINLVSKTPSDERELSFLANLTSARGLDLSGFYSEKFDKLGLTVFGSRNSGSAYDPADIGLTAIPKFERYTLNPRLFLYGKKTNADIGFTYIAEDRTGGSMEYIKEGLPGYYEKNNTHRYVAQGGMRHTIDEHSSLNLKASYSGYKRSILIPGYRFAGTQQSGFSELSYSHQKERMQWVGGINLLTDDFDEDKQDVGPFRDYHYNTLGLFVQNTWSPISQFTLESGLRGDYVRQYGFELLPRISALFKFNHRLTARIGGGMGYKTPTVFNEESEKVQFQNILPIDESATNNERSSGLNLDVNYRTHLGPINFSINQLFFYTKLHEPLVLEKTSTGAMNFVNANGHIDTKGIETNVKLICGDFKLFIGYTYADVNTHYDDTLSWLPLTSKHRLNNVLVYEKEGNIKMGLEAYYFSPQKLSDGSLGRSYWVLGFMVEKFWKGCSVFVNFENFTDTRQTRFGSIYTGPIDDPVFKDIYAPLDGFVINGGIKIRL